jgi:hypothetical protein
MPLRHGVSAALLYRLLQHDFSIVLSDRALRLTAHQIGTDVTPNCLAPVALNICSSRTLLSKSVQTDLIFARSAMRVA